jgi:hypothetical protein
MNTPWAVKSLGKPSASSGGPQLPALRCRAEFRRPNATADRVRKSREQAARRAAIRQNSKLERSRQRDRRGLAYGLYRLLDAGTGEVYASGDGPTDYNLDLDAVEAILDRGRR